MLGYFRGNRHPVAYADAKAKWAPIGRPNVVEAACNDLGHRTAQALRHASRGAAWRRNAILTLRSLVQSAPIPARVVSDSRNRLELRPVSCPDRAGVDP